MSKILINQRKTRFVKSQKRVAKTLIKPVENEDFLSRKRKKASKMIKSITFIDKTHTAFRYVKKPYKPNEKRGFSKVKNALRKPL